MLSVKYEPQFVQRHFRSTSGTSPFPIATMSAPDNSRCRRHALQPTLDDLPGAFDRRFVVRRIGGIVYDLATVPLPGTLGGDDRFHGFRLRGFLPWTAFRRAAVTMLVMAGGFDISRASLSRRAGERGRSVRSPPEAPLDARLPPLRSATFARPSSGHLAGRLPPDSRGRVE